MEEHFRRCTQPGHGRPGPWWYFLPVVAVGFLPWTGALPGALRDAFAVMSPATYRELAATGLPMTIMATDPRRIFVARGRWPRAGAAARRKPGP